jgi:hypothetical protein
MSFFGPLASTPAERDLMMAIREGDVSRVQRLLNAGTNVNASVDNISPLMQATHGGCHHIMRLLIERGADVNSANSVAETPLMLAAGHGDVMAFQMLLANGANPEARDVNGQTAMEIARRMAPGVAHVMQTDVQSHRANQARSGGGSSSGGRVAGTSYGGSSTGVAGFGGRGHTLGGSAQAAAAKGRGFSPVAAAAEARAASAARPRAAPAVPARWIDPPLSVTVGVDDGLVTVRWGDAIPHNCSVHAYQIEGREAGDNRTTS